MAFFHTKNSISSKLDYFSKANQLIEDFLILYIFAHNEHKTSKVTDKLKHLKMLAKSYLCTLILPHC